ncbi:MAG: hypothetical protein ABI602_03135 [Candidatus Saccharibacteria bacterium]
MSLEEGLADIKSDEAIAMANAVNFDGTRMKTTEEMNEILGTHHELKLRFPGIFDLAKHLVNTQALTRYQDPSPLAASERQGFEKGVNAALSTVLGLGLTEDLRVPELPDQPDQSTSQ